MPSIIRKQNVENKANDLNVPLSPEASSLIVNKDQIKESYDAMCGEMKELLTKKDRADFLLILEIERFLKFMEVNGQADEELKTFFQEQREKMIKEAEGFEDLYESYRIDAVFTLEIEKFIWEVDQAVTRKKEEKKAQKKREEISKRLNIIGEGVIFDEEPVANFEQKDGYNIETNFRLHYESRGIRIDLQGSEVNIDNYGEGMIINEIKLDGLPIEIINKNVFDLRIGGIKKIY